MEASKKRIETRARKKARIRKHMSGNEGCPRVSVFRSSKHIYVQAIDDEKGVTLASASTSEKTLSDQLGSATGNKTAAAAVGKALGDKLKASGIEKIVFDRNGFIYHGRVQSLADGIRDAGIKF